MSIYDYTIQDAKGKAISLKDFQGKPLLIVNTASQCGFTPQYKELQELYERYHAQGLEILAFPCNQFGQQEPGSNEEIQQFCQLNYGVSFPVFAKIEVNGENAHPLYKYLRAEKGGLLGDSIKWNFTKFLVDPDGQVIERFAPNISPEKIAPRIETLVKENQAARAG
jgi:glutathione peroxidase